jgi:hypothetical protein
MQKEAKEFVKFGYAVIGEFGEILYNCNDYEQAEMYMYYVHDEGREARIEAVYLAK